MLEFSKIKIYMFLLMCKMSYYTLPPLENQNRITSIIKEIQSFSKELSPKITICDLTFRSKQDNFYNVIK